MESIESKFEKKYPMEKVIGGNDEEKTALKLIIGQRFREQNVSETQEIKRLRIQELEKTEEEIEIIDLVDKETNKLLAKYDLSELTIPSKNIHVFSQEDYEKIRGEKPTAGKAHFTPRSQSVFMKRIDSNIVFTAKVFHEILHFKSFQAFQKEMTEEGGFDLYRLGLMAYSRDGKEEYFRNLNEAVTEELVKRFYFNNLEKLKNNPPFKKEVEEIEKIREKYLSVAKNEEDKKNAMDIFEITPVKKEGTRKFREIYTFGCFEKRDMLNDLIDKLYQKNQDKFKDREEVFDVFAKSMLSGNLLSVGKLVDRTLGRGTFRKIGELDKDVQKQKEFIETL